MHRSLNCCNKISSLLQAGLYGRIVKFGNTAEVKQKVSTLGERWSNRLIPAICQLAVETNMSPPSSDLPNGKLKVMSSTKFSDFTVFFKRVLI